MKKIVVSILVVLAIIAVPIIYFNFGPGLTQDQLDVGLILLIIAGSSALYCFIVGELSHNNSQMDKLWSLLPIAYTWVIAAKGGMTPRLIIMASLATLWGIRLTFNFARKGAYTIKFWAGEEDYRWKVLRENKMFQPHWKWMLFNFFFICIYQNLIVLLTCLPALAALGSPNSLNWIDILAASLTLFFLFYEFIADEQQWSFQTKKWKMINEGKKLEELPYPYNKGFNTVGLWNHSRHPNYLGEQMFWVSFYVFSIASGAGIYNWSIIGCLLLILLFMGSSMFAEKISSSKYPEYSAYQKTVWEFIPIPGKKYRRD